MLAPTGSLWERLSAIGTKDERGGELRRIHLTNQGAAISAVSCASFGLGYALAGAAYRVPMVMSLAALASAVAALFLNARGARTLAKIAVLLPANLAVVAASMVLGGQTGFLYYFFLFAAVALLFFAREQPLPRWGLALLSAASCVFVLVAGPRDEEVALLVTPMVARTLAIVSALAVIATTVFVVHLFTGDTARAEERLAEEHARSERLLLNILPAAISARLKDDGRSIADGFAEVTVLFADLVGFTELSQKLSPAELVEMLNRIFSAFDDLAERLGIEKIKTIGDCYMVAAGLPEHRVDHAEAVARMALGMRDALERLNAEHGYALRLRIGIHTGPVVAGVIGKRKFIYDLWGDTVNTASRMESSGAPREIQVTREVFARLEGKFELESRGTVTVKGKGEMQTYWLRSELAAG